MEIEENYVDHEIFDLNPLLDHEMTSDHSSFSSSSSTRRLISFDSHMVEKEKLDHSQIISFSSPSSLEDSKNPNPYHDVVNGVTRNSVSTTTRTRSQAQDHLMAERKRRENLSQLFITLSKVVPGLRKV